ncbi:MAG: LytTR family transcriptional regulator [Firmicutes bacterium]|nr:LytTR family transcriptional regulator [Candidatus Colivicinus equi]
MKYKFVIDENDESCIIRAPKKTELISKIEELILNDDKTLDGINIYGYLEKDIVPIKIADIFNITIEDEKTIAYVNNKKYQIKYRLYQLEQMLPENFLQINKSCIINLSHIKRFNSSWSAVLMVEMKNGYTDYVSRRQIKKVKRRMGL